MPRKIVGHAAAAGAYLIFGFNIIVCKNLTTVQYVDPSGIFLLRCIGAGAIFWLLSLWTPRQRVPWRDLGGIFLAAVFGFFLTQMTFLMAIPLITPMESAIMGSLTPVYTMLIAAVALGEPITGKKATGVALSLSGVVYLIATGMRGGFGADTSVWGLVLMTGNALCFSVYLGVFRRLISRYTVVTFMKWIFLFSTIMALPLGIPSLVSANPACLNAGWLSELAYLIVMATFVAYFLIPYAQKIIRPTIISMYSYLQPILAIAVSIALGMERLTIVKVGATLLVFAGVYIVSRSKRAAD